MNTLDGGEYAYMNWLYTNSHISNKQKTLDSALKWFHKESSPRLWNITKIQVQIKIWVLPEGKCIFLHIKKKSSPERYDHNDSISPSPISISPWDSDLAHGNFSLKSNIISKLMTKSIFAVVLFKIFPLNTLEML